ncbi:hypothetical protein V6N11_060145 [Hibiscus sabdariffa]|uniref:Secreted protein n=1 Tax=Hibiscus sabdariffa TaxID=183260 RepID=A0ABR2P314_9ROSI
MRLCRSSARVSPSSTSSMLDWLVCSLVLILPNSSSYSGTCGIGGTVWYMCLNPSQFGLQLHLMLSSMRTFWLPTTSHVGQRLLRCSRQAFGPHRL